MKKFLIILAIGILVGGLVYVVVRQRSVDVINTGADETTDSGGRRVGETEVSPQPVGKLKVINFTGKLEEVDTGCFADGECYVVVDGKHITALMGWSRETVGSVQGVEGFGDLTSHIGKQVEVYAQDMGDGTYTLYGSEGFYIKLK